MSHSQFEQICESCNEQFPEDVTTTDWAEKDKATCYICLDKIENTIYEATCIHDFRHTFHVNCMNSWLNRNNSCPICRKSQKEEIQPINTTSTDFIRSLDPIFETFFNE